VGCRHKLGAVVAGMSRVLAAATVGTTEPRTVGDVAQGVDFRLLAREQYPMLVSEDRPVLTVTVTTEGAP
jgi:hypothetical protein